MEAYSFLFRGTTTAPYAMLRWTSHRHVGLVNTTLRSTFTNRSLTTAAASTPTLLGPPEIYQQSAAAAAPADANAATSSANAAAAATTKTGDPFMDHMVSNFNNMASHYHPPMGFTENDSPTFLCSGNPCLDFFFHVVPDTPSESVEKRLQLAWDHDSLKALKLVYNLRAIRGTGKSDKEGFFTSALWLHNHHPKTLAANLTSVNDFGCFKDLPEILFRILEGPKAREMMKAVRTKEKWITARKLNTPEIPELYKLSRRERRRARAKTVVERFRTDPEFRALHESVSDVFAQFLKSDMKMLNSGDNKDLFRISLAAKWCPSLDKSFDRITLLCETIAKKVFPREEFPEYAAIEEAHYAYRVRDRLRKEVLVPLRKALQLPEVYMSANDWGNLPYKRVASIAMRMYQELFRKHDSERFHEFLGQVKLGKRKIAAGALLPHEIIRALEDDGDGGGGGEVAELQWRRMVDDMAKIGKLSNCLAISDVSGSMYGTPMEVSIALGILVSELSEEPWKGKLITFSKNPELQMVRGDSLREKSKFVEKMNWMMNTDFQKVFDLILKVAVDAKLKPEEMIQRLFVFSDMEFDKASARPWETDYQAIVRKFGEYGYGECVPEIVFWNLRDSRVTPVPSNQAGVALVSGFSKNLLSMFMENGGILHPEAAMDKAISGKHYQKLLVVD